MERKDEGLGARILDELVKKHPTVEKVSFTDTDYGFIGRLSSAEAERQQRLMQRMLDEAHQRAVAASPNATRGDGKAQ